MAVRSVGAHRARPTRKAPAAALSHQQLGLADEQIVDLYYAMLVARRLSERASRLASQGAIDVAIPSEGHEAAQVASMRALRKTDFAYLFYRSMPAAYARGMTAQEIMLDFFGREGGPSSGGKNLPGHWASHALRLMSVSGSVGTQVPNAVGTALATRIRGEDDVCIAYMGDAGASKADFHEGLNFAAVHHVPVILFCENNRIAISVPFEKQSPVESIAQRAAAYGVKGVSVDGSDALAVYRATAEAADRARRGEGPMLIEARVARLGQHTSQVGDLRPPEAMVEARRHDPLPRLERYLRKHGLLNDAGLRAIEEWATNEVADAVAHAERARSPERESALLHVYANR